MKKLNLGLVLVLIVTSALMAFKTNGHIKNQKRKSSMQVAVWDTYVQRADGKVMHFDILAESSMKDRDVIYAYGKKYLATKPFETGDLTAKECKFCHIEQATLEMEKVINEQGYFIIEMQNCN